MKKWITFLFIGAVSVSLSAQNIPDGGFETGWTQYEHTSGNYWDYQSSLFYSLNELYEEPLIGVLSTYRETENPQSGNYALKLVSKAPPTFIPGAIGTISPDFIQEFLDNGGLDVRKNFSFTEQPVALMGYYKYSPISGDSAAIDFAVYNGDVELAAYKKVEKSFVDNWTSFYLPLTYTTTDLPNKVKILFVASAAYDFANLQNCQGRENSTLYIDNIAFAYASGLVEPLMNNFKVQLFPNPAVDCLNFTFGEDVNAELFVYSITGALVAKQNVQGTNYSLNLSDIETGTYFYRLISNNTILNSGKFAVAK